MQKCELVEKSIFKKYRKEIWNKFIAGIKEYNLIQKGDKIAVCISGGKDSTLLAMCIKHLLRYSEIPFEAEYIVMDPGYSEINRQKIIENCKLLDLPIKIFDTKIFNIVDTVEKSPCYLCAKMRRGYLYKNAKDLGCNKIALGHHFDDVIETILMSMFYGGEIRTMMPKLHSDNFEGMQLIRPLYFVKEADVIAWARYNSLEFLQCACHFTESIANNDGFHDSKRQEMKELIKHLRTVNPTIDSNIFRSIHNVNMDTVIGYRKGGERHSFLEEYID